MSNCTELEAGGSQVEEDGAGSLGGSKDRELMNFVAPAVAVVVGLCFLLTLPPG